MVFFRAYSCLPVTAMDWVDWRPGGPSWFLAGGGAKERDGELTFLGQKTHYLEAGLIYNIFGTWTVFVQVCLLGSRRMIVTTKTGRNYEDTNER
jgi:hypothetical protein